MTAIRTASTFFGKNPRQDRQLDPSWLWIEDGNRCLFRIAQSVTWSGLQRHDGSLAALGQAVAFGLELDHGRRLTGKDGDLCAGRVQRVVAPRCRRAAYRISNGRILGHG
jgi:hypothetical protein